MIVFYKDIIGNELLKAFKRKLKYFFLSIYCPNNAILPLKVSKLMHVWVLYIWFVFEHETISQGCKSVLLTPKNVEHTAFFFFYL